MTGHWRDSPTASRVWASPGEGSLGKNSFFPFVPFVHRPQWISGWNMPSNAGCAILCRVWCIGKETHAISRLPDTGRAGVPAGNVTTFLGNGLCHEYRGAAIADDFREASASTGAAFGASGTNPAISGAAGISLDRHRTLLMENVGHGAHVVYPILAVHNSGFYDFNTALHLQVPPSGQPGNARNPWARSNLQPLPPVGPPSRRLVLSLRRQRRQRRRYNRCRSALLMSEKLGE